MIVVVTPVTFKFLAVKSPVIDILAGNLALSIVPVNFVASKLVIPEPSPDMFVADMLAGNLALSIVPDVILPASNAVILVPVPSKLVALILPTTSNVSVGSLVFIPTLPAL